MRTFIDSPAEEDRDRDRARPSLSLLPRLHYAASGLRRQLKEVNRIAGPDLTPFVLRHLSIDLLNERSALGPLTLDVRKVGGKHDPLHPNMVARFHGDPFVLHAKINVVPDILTRQTLQGLEPQIFFRPADVPLVPQVGGFEPEGHPPEARFREED